MFRPDSASRRDMVTDHAIALIAERGLAGVSMSAIAARLGISPQAIAKWVGSVDELWLWVIATFCRRWSAWTETRSLGTGALALLPEEPEEIAWARVLYAIEELARSRGDDDSELPAVFASLREDERQLLSSVHPQLTDPAGLTRLHALADGLRLAVCRAVDPLPLEEARALLAAECRANAGPLAAWLFPMASEELGLPRLVEANQPRDGALSFSQDEENRAEDPPRQVG